MKKTKSSWSVKTVNDKKGSYAIVAGTAYPEVLSDKNPPNKLAARIMTKRQYYNDPAIKLSKENLDDIDGAEGAPLCFEHERTDVVGSVSQTWLGDDGKKLRIVARIPLNERGKKIVDDIQAGEITGFSVGYRPHLDEDVVVGKTFHEISLVKKPFFDGCNISLGVFASGSSSEGEPSWFLGKQLKGVRNICVLLLMC